MRGRDRLPGIIHGTTVGILAMAPTVLFGAVIAGPVGAVVGGVVGALLANLVLIVWPNPDVQAAGRRASDLEQEVAKLKARPTPPDYTDPLVRIEADRRFRARGGHLRD